MQTFPTAEASARDAVLACISCERACRDALTASRVAGISSDDRDHVRLLSDGAEACQLAAKMLERESAFSAEICRLTAEICESTAESCRRFETRLFIVCAEQCARCAEACNTFFVMQTWRDMPVRGVSRAERPIH